MKLSELSREELLSIAIELAEKVESQKAALAMILTVLFLVILFGIIEGRKRKKLEKELESFKRLVGAVGSPVDKVAPSWELDIILDEKQQPMNEKFARCVALLFVQHSKDYPLETLKESSTEIKIPLIEYVNAFERKKDSFLKSCELQKNKLFGKKSPIEMSAFNEYYVEQYAETYGDRDAKEIALVVRGFDKKTENLTLPAFVEMYHKFSRALASSCVTAVLSNDRTLRNELDHLLARRVIEVSQSEINFLESFNNKADAEGFIKRLILRLDSNSDSTAKHAFSEKSKALMEIHFSEALA
jgi:hypothetical protein